MSLKRKMIRAKIKSKVKNCSAKINGRSQINFLMHTSFRRGINRTLEALKEMAKK